jgi:AcrR family transcriptional regulator
MTPPGARPPAGVEARNRVERRKAQTRKKLIDAARAMLANDASARASIQEITNTAAVGHGSFYNHFSSKSELFEAALADVVEELRELLDQISIDVDDPALSFAQSLRLTLGLCRRRPQISAVLIRHRMNHIDSQQGHIRAAMACGRFRRAEPRLTRAAVFGAALATLQLALTEPDLVDDAACDQLAEQMLRMLGVPFADARTLAHAPLPPAELPKPG